MRRLALLLSLALASLPVFAGKRITVEQLEQLLTAAHGKSDAETARQLAGLDLIERFTTARLVNAEATLPGPESRQALLLVADTSAFLNLPVSEMAAAPPPPFAVQRQIIASTVNYVSQTLHQLPNFSATRTTARYQDEPQGFEKGGTVFVAAQPLSLVARSSAGVIYRNGGEVVDAAATKNKKSEPVHGLTTTGEFGPILATMLIDAAHGKLAWSHWEQTDLGTLAVFQYSVSREQSHYEVTYCCVPFQGGDASSAQPFHQVIGYHGEFAVDPSNGAALRVAIQGDLKSTDPIVRADMIVEYGRVELGGKIYICPLKGIAISLGSAVEQESAQSFRTGRISQSTVQYAPGHLQTLLNDITFEQYHVFRADSHLVATDNPPPDSPAPASNPATGETTAIANPAPSTPAQVAVTSVTDEKDNTSANVTPEPQPPPQPADADATATPSQADFKPQFTQPGAEVPVFKANSEAVAVDVVVTKGNGEPVRNLRREDFQVAEDGKPQPVDLFEEHDPADPPVSTAGATKLPANVFTNEPAAPPGDSVNVLLLDSLNTPRQDQAYVHQQILSFLKNRRPGARVAIFTLGSKLRFVQGFTEDDTLLRSALNEHATRGPESTPASRTHEDDVEDAQHLQTMETMAGGHTAAIDASQDAQANFAAYQGSDAASMTLAALRYLALYLAGIPGRKNLIWFSSSFPVAVFPSAHEKQPASSAGDYVKAVRATANLLTLSKVAIYPVGAQGMMVSQTVESQAEGAQGSKTNPMLAYADSNGDHASKIIAMEQLASSTGGEAIFNTNDLNQVLARVIQNGSHYYTLVYTPTDKSRDGKYRRITIKVNGGKYKLAFRQGYYADPLAASDSTAEADPLRPLLAYGMPSATQLLYGVRVLPASPQPDPQAVRTEGNPRLTGPLTRYNVDFMIRWTDVDLEPTPRGTHQGRIQVGLIAYGRDGKALNWVGATQSMNLNGATFAAIQRSGIPAHLEVDLPPGEAWLATGVYDWGSSRTGTLQVPLADPARTAQLGADPRK